MSLQQSESSIEIPDRSLGSLSLIGTGDGEQLDDIQMNLDRMYLESPAPSSSLFIQANEGPSSITPANNNNIRRTSRHQLQTRYVNNSLALALPNEELEENSLNFDKLSLIDLTQVEGTVEGDNWLVDVTSDLPPNFDEDDRSFLDTNLLNKRFFLLNYVTRVMNEEAYAGTTSRAPVAAISNLVNESPGSAATFRVARPHPNPPVVGASGRAIFTPNQNGFTRRSRTPPPNTESEDNTNTSARVSPSYSIVGGERVYSSEDEQNSSIITNHAIAGIIPPQFNDRYMKGISSGSMTYRRPPMQRQSNVLPSSQGQDTGSGRQSPSSYARQTERNQSPTDESGFVTGNYAHLGNRTIRLSNRRGSGSYASDRTDFIPDDLSPVSSAPTSRLVPIGARNGYDMNGSSDEFSEGGFPHNDGGSPYSREIDTRTYTRPKKNRMSLGTPTRHTQLNTTMNLSHHSPLLTTTPNRLLNTTMTLPTPPRHPVLGTPNKLNTTMDLPTPPRQSVVSPTKLNTTINMSSEKKSPTPPPHSANLNETFVQESGDLGREATKGVSYTVLKHRELPPNERPVLRNRSYIIRRFDDQAQNTGTGRPVIRNASYTIRKIDEGSPNNNSTSPVHSNPSPKQDLNSTFSFEADHDPDAAVTRGSQNTSMEDLNSRVASQIRSLGCSTITKGRLMNHAGNLEEARMVARTSSTDTYSVAHSSESPTSSGLSSPMDTQCYEDIQSSESVRRSMPNLAVIRGATTQKSNLVFPQAGAGQLRKNHYISDSRLSRIGFVEKPRLSVPASPDAGRTSPYNRTRRQSDIGRPKGVTERNTSTPAALNHISTMGPANNTRIGSANTLSASSYAASRTSYSSQAARAQTTLGANVRSTGIAPPRYIATAPGASAPGSGLRPPRPLTAGATPRNPGGIPVPTFKTTSRIPGPGQLRFSRPSSSASNRISTSGKSTSQKGPVDDWRDGCY